MPNFDIMTEKERELWDFTQEIHKDAIQNAIDSREEFNETIVCAICETTIGYSKDRMMEAICEGCADQ